MSDYTMHDGLVAAFLMAMAKHMVAGCPTCFGAGTFTVYTYEWVGVGPPPREAAPVETTKECSRCSELLALLKQVEGS